MNAIRAALDELCGSCYNLKAGRCCKAAGESCSRFAARAELARVEKEREEGGKYIESLVHLLGRSYERFDREEGTMCQYVGVYVLAFQKGDYSEQVLFREWSDEDIAKELPTLAAYRAARSDKDGR